MNLTLARLGTVALAACTLALAAQEPAADSASAAMLKKIYAEALVHGQAYDRLSELVGHYPFRLSGSAALDGALGWAEATLKALPADRVFTQPVMVPHWERGAPESVALIGADGQIEPLSATALGGSGATSDSGLSAGVIEVKGLEELEALPPSSVAGKIVFFNRPMNPDVINPLEAYAQAGDQRNRGPAAAAKLGACAALVRSLTHAHDDIPHTGMTAFPPNRPKIPAAALSTVAADRLSAALAADPGLQVRIAIHARTLPPAPSKNTIGELRGSTFPDQIILVGGHLDSWDIAPGAHDDGAGVVESIEVLRIFKALGIKPRHTLRCVLFVNEENGTAGANEYASEAKSSPEKHILAIETDFGGFQPLGFSLGNTRHDAHLRAARWLPLFKPYGIASFEEGPAGTDVAPLLLEGVTVGELRPNSQRYFDIHHTRADSLDKVNPRELELGAAALASLIWLADTQGL